jgi:hypothetical protein
MRPLRLPTTLLITLPGVSDANSVSGPCAFGLASDPPPGLDSTVGGLGLRKEMISPKAPCVYISGFDDPPTELLYRIVYSMNLVGFVHSFRELLVLTASAHPPYLRIAACRYTPKSSSDRNVLNHLTDLRHPLRFPSFRALSPARHFADFELGLATCFPICLGFFP